jgi:hypothetical protein
MKNILNNKAIKGALSPANDYKNNNRMVASGVSRRVFEFVAYTTGDGNKQESHKEGHFVLKSTTPTITTKPTPAHRSATLR